MSGPNRITLWDKPWRKTKIVVDLDKPGRELIISLVRFQKSYTMTSHRRRGRGPGLLNHLYKPAKSKRLKNTGGSIAISKSEVELGRDP